MKTFKYCTAVLMGLAVVFTAGSFPALAARKALLVGVERYRDPSKNLEGVSDDVRLMKEVITTKVGFHEKDVKVLLNEQATKENIVKSFREWLIEGTALGDTVLFYFSGHGAQVWDENGHEIQDGKAKALIPHDGNVIRDPVRRTFDGRSSSAFDLKDTVNALLGDEIHTLLSQLKGRSVIFIIDSCHSGSVYKDLNERLVKNKNFQTPTFFKGILEKRFSTPKSLEPNKPYIGEDLTIFGVRLAAFTACENSQVAQVVSFTKDPKGPHSVFTWYLYHALQGEADLRRDGKISFASVAKYVQDSVKHDGYPQVPQYEFQPESLGNETLETQVVKAEAPIIRPHRIGYALKAGTGISSADVEKIHSTIGRYIPALQWTDKQDEATAIIVIEKRGNLYLAQISDSTGAVWESQHGTTLDEALKGLLGNLRALYVQASISALRNPASRADFDIKYGIRGNASRSAGEVVKGDVIVLNGKTKTPGYLYIFSVDTMGVIHPLYPMPESGPERLESNRSVVIGADNSFTVQEPFGRDMIFAFLVPKQYDSLAAFWNEDDIGDLGDSGISEQERFLNVLWSALTANGKPRGDWRGKVIVLRSFPK